MEEDNLKQWQNQQYLQNGADLFGGVAGSFDYSQQGYSLNDARQFGENKGGQIGGALLGAAGSLLGPLGSIGGKFLGQKLGSLVGGNVAEKRAEPVIRNREMRKQNFTSMYSDIARNNQINEQQRQGQLFIDSQYKTANLPSIS